MKMKVVVRISKKEGQQEEVSDDDLVSSEAEATTYTPSLGWRV